MPANTALTPYIKEITDAINTSTIKTEISIDKKAEKILKITVFTLSAAILAAAIIRYNSKK